MKIKNKISRTLRWSEKYFKTDMTYVAKGSFWIFTGKAGQFLVSLLVMTSFSRFSTKEVFGTYQYVLSLAALFSIFSLPGIGTSLVRSVAKGKEGTLRLAVKEKLKFSIIGSILLIAVSIWYFNIENPELGYAILIAALFFPFYKTFRIFGSFWQGKKRFDLRSKYTTLSVFLSAIMLLPIIYITDDIILIIAVFFLAHSLFDGIFLRKTLYKSENTDNDEDSLSYGKHLSLIKSPGIITGHIDRIIIWNFLGPVQVAIYSFAYLLIQKTKNACPLSALALPKLKEENVKHIKQGIISKFKKLLILTIPIISALILLAPYIYLFLFPEYEASIPYFRVLSILLFFAPVQLLQSALIAAKRQKELYLISFIIPSIRLVLFFVLIPFFQLWGVVAALLGSTVISSIMHVYFFHKI